METQNEPRPREPPSPIAPFPHVHVRPGKVYAEFVRHSGEVERADGSGPGDHVCWVHDGRDPWHAVAIPYLLDGAHSGEQLLYIADKPPSDLVADLAGLPGRDAMLRSAQLRVVPLQESHGPPETFDPARQLEYFHRAARAAVRAGYRGLRLAVEVSLLSADPDGARRFTAFELLADSLVAASPMSVLCGYDERVVGPHAAMMLCAVHPLRHGGSQMTSCSLYAEDDGTWRLSGELDRETLEPVELGFAALAALPPAEDVHLRLDGLEFFDVAGARALVALAARLAPDRRLVLHDPPALLVRVLALGWGPVPGLQVVRS